MNVTVTGARGFLGRNVVEALLARGHSVFGLDQSPCELSLPAGARQAQLDITDAVALGAALNDESPEAVIHLAATTIGASHKPALGIRVNVAGTQAVLDAARLAGARRCLVASSTAVFGDAVYGTRPLDEDTPVAPTTTYGSSKVAVEALVRLADAANPDLEGVVVRLPALFGPWEQQTEHRVLMSPLRQLVSAIAGGDAIVLAERGHRDWTYAPDAAEALVTLVTAPALADTTYHVGCGTTWNVVVLAQAMRERGTDIEYSVGPLPTLDYGDTLTRTRVALDSSRVRRELDVTFMPPAVACQAYLDWLDVNGQYSASAVSEVHTARKTSHE